MNSLSLIWRAALSQLLASTILTGHISQPWTWLPGFCGPLSLTIVFLCTSVKKIKGKYFINILLSGLSHWKVFLSINMCQSWSSFYVVYENMFLCIPKVYVALITFSLNRPIQPCPFVCLSVCAIGYLQVSHWFSPSLPPPLKCFFWPPQKNIVLYQFELYCVHRCSFLHIWVSSLPL